MEYTIADIYALPDGERAELFDGKIYYMSPPGYTHQSISMNLSGDIHAYIKNNNGKCKVIPAPFAVFLSEDDKTYVEPDISVVCDTNKLDEKGCHGAPDWIIEIVSKSSKSRDYVKKLLKYRSAGVREYWIVNPMERRVIVYSFEKDDEVNDYVFGDEVPVGIFEGFSLRVNDW